MTDRDRPVLDVLEEALRATALIARNFAESRTAVDRLLPVDEARLASLRRADRVEINAFLLEFLQLAGMLQDKVTRLILVALEQDLTQASRLDMRNMLEKVRALEPERAFGKIVDVRNRVAHDYPLQPARKAEMVNEAFERSGDLLAGYEDITGFANHKFYGGRLELPSPRAKVAGRDQLP